MTRFSEHFNKHIPLQIVILNPENLPPVSTTLGKLVEKFAAGVVDTGGAP
jgi:hypothetical protein